MKSTLDEATQGYTAPTMPRPTPPLDYAHLERPAHSSYHPLLPHYPYQYSEDPYAPQTYPAPNSSYSHHRITPTSKSYGRPPERPGTSRSVVVTRVGPAEVLGTSAAMASQIITSLPNAAYPDRPRQGPSQVYTHPLASSQPSQPYRYESPSHPDFNRRPRAPAAHRPETPKATRRSNKMASATAALIRAEAPTTLGETLAREDVWNPDDPVVYGRTSDPIPHRDLLSDCAYIKRVENPYRAHRSSETHGVSGEHQIFKYRNEAYGMRPEERRKCNGEVMLSHRPDPVQIRQASPRQPDRRMEDVLDLSLKTVRQSADSTEPDEFSSQPLQLTTPKNRSYMVSPGALHSQDSNGVSASTSQAPSPQLLKRPSASPAVEEPKTKHSRLNDAPFRSHTQYQDLRAPTHNSSLDPARGYPPPEIASKYPNLSVSNSGLPQSFHPVGFSGHPDPAYMNSSPYPYYNLPDRFAAPRQSPTHRTPEAQKDNPPVPSTSATQRRHVLLDTSLYVKPSSKTNHVTVLSKPSRPSSANRDSPCDARSGRIQEPATRLVKPESPRISEYPFSNASPSLPHGSIKVEDGCQSSSSTPHSSRYHPDIVDIPKQEPIPTEPSTVKIWEDETSIKLKSEKMLNHLKENSNVNGDDSKDKNLGMTSDVSGKENKFPLKPDVEHVEILEPPESAECAPPRVDDTPKFSVKEGVDSSTSSSPNTPVVPKALNLSKEPLVSVATIHNHAPRPAHIQSSEPVVIDLASKPKYNSPIEHKPYANVPQAAKSHTNVIPAHSTPTLWDTAHHLYPKYPSTYKNVEKQTLKEVQPPVGYPHYPYPQSHQPREPSHQYPQSSDAAYPWGHSAKTPGYTEPPKDPFKTHSRPSEPAVSVLKHYPQGLYEKPRESDASSETRWKMADPATYLHPKKESPSPRSEHSTYPGAVNPVYGLPHNSLYQHAHSKTAATRSLEADKNAPKSNEKRDWSYAYSSANHSIPYSKAAPSSTYAISTYDYHEAWRKTETKDHYERVARGDPAAKTPPVQSSWAPVTPHYAHQLPVDHKDKLSSRPRGYPSETYPVPEKKVDYKQESIPNPYAQYSNSTSHVQQSSPYYNTHIRPTAHPSVSYNRQAIASNVSDVHTRPKSPRSLIPTNASLQAKPARSPHSPTHPPPPVHDPAYAGYQPYPVPSQYPKPPYGRQSYPVSTFAGYPPSTQVSSQYPVTKHSAYQSNYHSEAPKNYPPPPAAHKSSAHAATIVTQSHITRPPFTMAATLSTPPNSYRDSADLNKHMYPHEAKAFARAQAINRATYPAAKSPARFSHLDPQKSSTGTPPMYPSEVKNEPLPRHNSPKSFVSEPARPGPSVVDVKAFPQPSIKKETPSPVKSPRPGSSGCLPHRGSLPFQTPIKTPDVFDNLEKQLQNTEEIISKRSKILEDRYTKKLQLQRAYDNGENIEEEELPYYEESESDSGPVVTKFRGKFKSFKDKNKERILLTYASHSDDSDNELLPDDDASDFEQTLIEEIKSLGRGKRSRRLSPSDSSVSKESTSDTKFIRRRKIATKSEDSSCYSANTESDSSSNSDSSSEDRLSCQQRSKSSSSCSDVSTGRRVTRRSKNLRLKRRKESSDSDSKKHSNSKHVKRKTRHASRSSSVRAKRKQRSSSGSSDEESTRRTRKKRNRIAVSSDSDSSVSKIKSKNDSILDKLEAQRKSDASRRDVIEMRARQEEEMKKFSDRLKILPETPLRYSWRRPSFVSSFKKGWQADLRRYKLTVARTPKSLVSIPVTPTTDRKQRGRSQTKVEPDIKKESRDRSTGYVMQEFFSKVMGENLGDDDSIPRPPLSPCSTFTPTGLTPTPSVEPSMLIPGIHDSDRDSLANLRDPSPPMSDSAALRRRSIVSSLMKKLQSHTTSKKSRLSDIHWLSKSRSLLKQPTHPQKLPTPVPLESSDDGSGGRKKYDPRSRFRSIFGEDPPPSSSTPSPKLSLEARAPLRKKGRIIAIYYPNSASSTPSTPMEVDDASPVSVGQHSGKKRKTKKFRSGLDYIPKKKKKFKEEDVTTTVKKRIPARKKVLWPEDSRDVAAEVRGWVINKGLGETVLHKAARLQYHDVVVYCLESGDTDVNARDNAGYTPLHEACNRGHLDIVQALLAYGARVNAPGYRGMRPLHEACDNGHLDLVRILMRYGADINLTSYAGQPCLAISDDACGKLIQGFTADIKGWSVEPWTFTGPASCFDNTADADCLQDIPIDSEHSSKDEESFFFESSQNPLPPTYHVTGADGIYVLMRDILEAKQTTQLELIKDLGSISTLTFKKHQFEKRCNRLDGILSENVSKNVVLVKYTESVQKWLKVDVDYV